MKENGEERIFGKDIEVKIMMKESGETNEVKMMRVCSTCYRFSPHLIPELSVGEHTC